MEKEINKEDRELCGLISNIFATQELQEVSSPVRYLEKCFPRRLSSIGVCKKQKGD